MPLNFTRVRAFVFELPRHAKLAYCLLRDERVPTAPKAALLGALGLIVSPIDFPVWIPVLGELDMLALGVLAIKVFVDACPDALVAEHRALVERGESAFDRDFKGVTGTAGQLVRQAAAGAAARLRRSGGARLRLLAQLEDRSA